MKTQPMLIAATILQLSLVVFDTKAQECRLTKILSRLQSTEIESHFKLDSTIIAYDKYNHIISLGPGTTVITDSKGRITELSRTAAGASTETFVDTKTTYTYDQNDNLTEYRVIPFTESTPRMSVKYTYNSYGQLVGTHSVTNRKEFPFVTRLVYAYPNKSTKNPSTVQIYAGGMSSEPSIIIEYTYDNKKRAFEVIGLYEHQDNQLSTNNVTSETYSGPGALTKKPKIFTYEYNQAGYPISKSDSIGNNTYTQRYIYSCQGK